MKIAHRGFVPLLIVLIVGIAALAGGGYYITTQRAASLPKDIDQESIGTDNTEA